MIPIFNRRTVLFNAAASALPIAATPLSASARTTAVTPQQIASLSDQELRDLVKLAFFWGMHPAGIYEGRYVYTQLKSHSNYVGDGRIKWDRKPRTAADKSVSTPNATTLYGFGYANL
jgi:hypothetical protein